MHIGEREIIEKYKIKRSDKVLDIGGAMEQRKIIKVDTLVDIISPEEAPYTPSRLRAKKFFKLDVTSEKLPFGNKEFDFCICSHTLEDLSSPFLVMAEMQRVAKRGLIITPSWGFDMVFSHIDFTDWGTGARRLPGQGHHKWFFEKKGRSILRVVPKITAVLYTPEFHITGWRGEDELVFYWRGNFEIVEEKSLNIHTLIDNYRNYLAKNKSKIEKGRVLIFVDRPWYFLKAGVKYLLNSLNFKMPSSRLKVKITNKKSKA